MSRTCALCGKSEECEHSPAERCDWPEIAATLQNRGWVAIPKQYLDLAKKIATTGFWPQLYDADGKPL